MSWIKFTFWLTGIYLSYYVLLILWDRIRQGGPVKAEETRELTFVEHHEVTRPESKRNEPYPVSSVISSGGVSLKQLFNLAQLESVEFTRPVSF